MRLKRFAFRNPGITIFLIAVVIRIIFGMSQEIFNTVYFNFLFPIIRNVQSLMSPIWIIPGYYVLLILGIVWIIIRFPRSKKWRRFLKRFANFAGAIIAIFLFLWGFNYANVGYASRAELPALPDSTNIAGQYEAVMNCALMHRSEIPEIETVPTVENLQEWPSDAEIDNWVQAVLLPEGYPAKPKIRVRHIKPEGTLRRINITGIYNPFSGEANVDSGLPHLLLIFTTAHEIAHAYGITSEAEANFVAYLACLKSKNPAAQYAAEYALWRYFANEINMHFPEDVIEALAAKIPEPLRKDREEILITYFKYKGYFPEVTDAINDTYLKIQGVKSGTDDYNDFLKLYLRWNLQNQKLRES